MPLLIRFSELKPMPWKNGGGSTTEIIRMPREADLEHFAWRISLATIASNGPFSQFPGIDRSLSLVDGDGVRLDFSGGKQVVLTEAAATIAFAGEESVSAELLQGATLDFNVMTRRERCRHRFSCKRINGRQTVARGDARTLIFLAGGESLDCTCGAAAFALDRYDSVLLDKQDALFVECSAAAATLFWVEIDEVTQ